MVILLKSTDCYFLSCVDPSVSTVGQPGHPEYFHSGTKHNEDQ